MDSTDKNDEICCMCELGGNLLCCDGKCLRSFHSQCLKLTENELSNLSSFTCKECSMRIHRCFSCNNYGLEEDLVKCSRQSCGKFYHISVIIILQHIC